MGQPDVSVVVLGALNVFGIGMIDVFVIFYNRLRYLTEVLIGKMNKLYSSDV